MAAPPARGAGAVDVDDMETGAVVHAASNASTLAMKTHLVTPCGMGGRVQAPFSRRMISVVAAAWLIV